MQYTVCKHMFIEGVCLGFRAFFVVWTERHRCSVALLLVVRCATPLVQKTRRKVLKQLIQVLSPGFSYAFCVIKF